MISAGERLDVPKGRQRVMIGVGVVGQRAPTGLHLMATWTLSHGAQQRQQIPLEFPQGAAQWRDVVLAIPDSATHAAFAPGPRGAKELASVRLSRPAWLVTPTAPNLVLISIDTLRADYLGAYGYTRFPTSPTLDAIARDGTLFEWAIAPSPWTVPSHMAMLTGMDANALGMDQLVGETPRLSPNESTLAELFSRAGYLTAAFTGSATMAAKHGFADGFYLYQESYAPDRVVQRDLDTNAYLASQWLRQHAERPLFLFFHTFEVHAPYIHSRFAQARLRGIAHEKALYASGIAYTDDRLRGFLHELDRLGVTKDALIVITSDHGEGFRDAHGAHHGRNLYDEVLHVPLIFAGPGIPVGRRIKTPVPSQDLFATLVDYFELVHPTEVQSRSLMPWVRNATGTARPTYLCCMAHKYQRRGMRDRGFKYVISFPTNLNTATEELYDLSADPNERENLAPRQPERLGEMRRWTAARSKKNHGKMLGDFRPNQLDTRYREQLRALGYVE